MDERDALQQRVFPRLRELCLARGARFQPVDLRWGVGEEASRDQQALNIRLAEVERCRLTSPRPNFIVLLGDRYGWRPPPPQIPVDEFERLATGVTDAEDRKLLEGWYLRDDNAVPAERRLRSREGEFEDREAWAPVEARLCSILETAARSAYLEDSKYGASATEQEIVNGALTVPDASEHVFCFLRTIADLPADASAGSFRDLDANGQPDNGAAERLALLKERLRGYLPGNVHEYAAAWTDSGPSREHLDQLCDDVESSLSRLILSGLERIEEHDDLDHEVDEHRRFGARR